MQAFINPQENRNQRDLYAHIGSLNSSRRLAFHLHPSLTHIDNWDAKSLEHSTK
jgi:hypothetical protein